MERRRRCNPEEWRYVENLGELPEWFAERDECIRKDRLDLFTEAFIIANSQSR